MTKMELGIAAMQLSTRMKTKNNVFYLPRVIIIYLIFYDSYFIQKIKQNLAIIILPHNIKYSTTLHFYLPILKILRFSAWCLNFLVTGCHKIRNIVFNEYTNYKIHSTLNCCKRKV